MKLPNMSERIRMLSGAALMLAAYSPVFFDFIFNQESETFEVCSNQNGNADIFQKGSFVGFALNQFSGAASEENVSENISSELLRNNMSYVAMIATSKSDAPLAKKAQQVSPIKVILSGEFAGAMFVKSSISSNFYTDARRIGVPAKVVDSIINNLSSKIDFRRSLKQGDLFEILYNKKNEMLYSQVVTKRKKAAVYRVASEKGAAYYFDNGAKVAFNKSNSFGQPLSGRLHVSSSFGYRRHPISGVYKKHTGVDFRANRGTPVLAIFDGVVTRASRYYGYGHCVDIKHASGYTSRYAHLNGYNVRCGARVKKGQLIGSVGSSGVSTGDHLHLELAKNNKVLNPLSVKMMPDVVAVVPNMRKFKAMKKNIERLALSGSY